MKEEEIITQYYNNNLITNHSYVCSLYFMNKIKNDDNNLNIKYLISPLNIKYEYGDIIFSWKYLKIKLQFYYNSINLYYKENNIKTINIGDGNDGFALLISTLNTLIK